MEKEIVVSSIRPHSRSEEPVEGYLEYIGNYLDKAGLSATDIACLPEDFMNLQEKTEKSTGAIASYVKEKARKNKMYVIMPITEEIESGKYTSAVLIDRNGEITGRYLKTHPIPMETEKWGISKGNSLPVFETDFGKIGIMICFDGYFPEVATIMSRKGARIIFYPHRQDSPDIQAYWLHIRARAMDNCVYLVSATCGIKKDEAWMGPDRTGHLITGNYPSCIVGPDGNIIAGSGFEEGILTAKIDINKPYLVYGHGEPGICDMKKILSKHRRPELYRREDGE